MRNNNTLYLHFQVTVENPFYKDYQKYIEGIEKGGKGVN